MSRVEGRLFPSTVEEACPQVKEFVISRFQAGNHQDGVIRLGLDSVKHNLAGRAEGIAEGNGRAIYENQQRSL